MGDHNQQQHYGHTTPSFSGQQINISDPVYHMNQGLSIQPVNSLATNTVVPNTNMPQRPPFYDQTGVYPQISNSGVHPSSNMNPIQQTYCMPPQQQATFSQPLLSSPQEQLQQVSMQTGTNEMYQETLSGNQMTSPIANMLSFQPLPQQPEKMFNPNTGSQIVQNATPQPGPQPHPQNLVPNFQAATPPPLSQLQGTPIYHQQQPPHQQPCPVGVSSPTSKPECVEINQTFKAPSTNKVTKSKNTKKKAVSQTQGKPGKSPESTSATSALFVDPVLPSSVEISPQSSPGIQSHTSATQGGNTFPKLKDLVGRLLSYTLDAYTDKDFGEKTLMNLARKLSATSTVTNEDTTVLNTWEYAIKQKTLQSGCVCIQRPREGRITVTKSGTGSSGSKKVFPQIVLCQMFRFPNIVFHHDIKSSEHCQNPSAVKPNVVNPGSGEAGEPDFEGGSDMICLNPYHYIVSPEGNYKIIAMCFYLYDANKILTSL